MDEKEQLISRMESVLGLVPANTRMVLNVLVHPDLIEYTKRYVRANDRGSKCTKYEAPWSCLREAEAKFENIKFGWVGSPGTEVMLDWICESCRKRITEE